MSFFSKIWEHIENLFTDVEKSVAEFVESLASTIAHNGGTVLIAAAASAVIAAEKEGGTGSQKLAAAQAAVAATLTAQGIDLVWNAINGAIEAAVAQHKLNLAEMPA